MTKHQRQLIETAIGISGVRNRAKFLRDRGWKQRERPNARQAQGTSQFAVFHDTGIESLWTRGMLILTTTNACHTELRLAVLKKLHEDGETLTTQESEQLVNLNEILQ
jgi:hypothetical protein